MVRAAALSVIMTFALTPFVGPALAEEKKDEAPAEKKTDGSAEGLVKTMKAYFAVMASEKEEDHLKALNSLMPAKADLVALFPKHGEKLWEAMSGYVKMMREHVEDIAKECRKLQGPSPDVEAINVRENNDSGRYTEVLKIVPEDLPIYRIVAGPPGEGKGGISTFIFVNGRWIWFRGFEGTPKAIEMIEKGEWPPKPPGKPKEKPDGPPDKESDAR